MMKIKAKKQQPRLERPGALKRRIRGSLPFYGFISPWVIGTLCLTIYPLIYALQVSFTNWTGTTEYAKFVGWENYLVAFQDSATWASLARTGVLALVLVPFNIVGGLLLALLLNHKVPGQGLFRTLIYLPAVVPVVASALVWKMLFDRDSGAVNGILGMFGVDAVPWMTGNHVFIVLLVTLAWGIGSGVILNLAALQGVPPSLHEAAKLDGANAWQAFRAVTLPSISPVLLFQVITGIIAALQTFLPSLLLTSGGGATGSKAVPEANRVYMVEVYDQFFGYGNFGMGSAMLWILFIVILIITGLTFKLSANSVHYSSGIE